MLKFGINLKFSEWEQVSYTHQPIAKAAGIFGLYRCHEPDNKRLLCRVAHTLKEQHVQKITEVDGAVIAASGRILEPANSKFYLN